MLIPPLLRESPTFRRFWAGQTVSLVGDQVSLIALPLVAVLVLDANAAQMGYLVAAELLPNLLFSLHAGAWADRRARKRQTMIATDIFRALLLASIPLAYAFDALTFPHMLVVAFLMGTLTVLFHVSYSSFYPALVPRERLVEGGQIMHGSRALSYVAGPSIGGLLVQAISAPVTLVVDACSYVVSALFLRTVDVEEPATEPPGERPRRRGRALGLRQPDHPGRTRRDRDDQLLQLRLRRALHPLRDDRARSLAGDARARARRRRGRGHPRRRRHRPRHALDRRRPRLRARVRPLPRPAPARPARRKGPQWVILACLFLAEFGCGFGVMMLDISAGAIAAAVVPDRLRSRVSGAYMVVNYGVRPVGALVGGALGSWIGLRETLWIATAGALLGVLWLLPSPILGLRELPEPETATG